jgi:hypothetical protein
MALGSTPEDSRLHAHDARAREILIDNMPL